MRFVQRSPRKPIETRSPRLRAQGPLVA